MLAEREPVAGKAPFRIPSMSEVAAARGSAGLTVASTFSGCGGSCLGFEMAGYRVLWANEFLPIAQESYRANHPETLLDGRDITKVQASDILDAIGLEPGELDVFNGSPPCQAFSSAGQRSKGWGKDREYSNGIKQKNEDLFFEYIRLLEGLKPRVFVAENVAGLTRGVALGYFKQIMRGLDAAGYVVRCKVLDAQWLGVPQSRQRAIFVGVRKDLGLEPDFPKPWAHRYTLRDVLPGLAGYGNKGIGGWKDQRRGSVDESICTITCAPGDYTAIERGPEYLSEGRRKRWEALRPGESDPKNFGLVRQDPDRPANAVCALNGEVGKSAPSLPHEPRRFTIEELRIICSFPADFVLKGSYAEQWARLGNAVPPIMMREIAAVLRDGVFEKLGRTRAGFSEAR